MFNSCQILGHRPERVRRPLAGAVVAVTGASAGCLAWSPGNADADCWPMRAWRWWFREVKGVLHSVDRGPAPSLLPVLGSQQQGEILALVLGDPDLEVSLTDIARRTGVPHPSVHREIQRAERAGLVMSRRVSNVRLMRADTGSPYYAGLAEVLTRAFGVPAVLARELRKVRGIDDAACRSASSRTAFVVGGTSANW
jgi:DNA-binding transcriptional ArsR family regulator